MGRGAPQRSSPSMPLKLDVKVRTGYCFFPWLGWKFIIFGLILYFMCVNCGYFILSSVSLLLDLTG